MAAHRGFTLIELMVTLAVIAILAAVATPQVGRWMQNTKLKTGVIDLLVAIQHVRMLAVKEDRNLVLTFDPDGDGRLDGTYTAFVDNGGGLPGLWTREADERIATSGRVPPGVSLIEASFAGGVPRIRFNQLGLPNGLGGHVYMKNKVGRYMGIHVNINGSARIVRSPSGEKGTWE